MKKRGLYKNHLPKILVIMSLFIVIFALKIYAPIDDETTSLETGVEVYSTSSEGNTEEDLFVFDLKDKGATFEKETGTVTVSDVTEASFDINYLNQNSVTNIKSKDGSVISLKEGIERIDVENGVATVVFSKKDTPTEITFEKEGRTYTISAKQGSVKLTENGLIFEKNMEFTTSEGQSISILSDNTKIRLEDGKIRISGYAAVEYNDKINYELVLAGKKSIIEVIQEDNEKLIFMHSDDPGDIYINLGFYHNSDECKEKNCISYKEEEQEIPETGEIKYYNKLKIDGTALITKYYDDEIAYIMNFDDSKFLINKEGLSNLNDLEFSKKMVINYNNGDLVINVLKSGDQGDYIEVKPKDGVSNVYINGKLIISDEQLYVVRGTYFSKENIEELISNAKNKKVYVEGEQTNLYSFVDENLVEINDEIDTAIMLALIKQEVTNDIKNNQPTQSESIAFHQVLIENPEKYKGYFDKEGNLIVSINDEFFWDEKGNLLNNGEEFDLSDYTLVNGDGNMINENNDNTLIVQKHQLKNLLENNPSLDLNVGADYLSYCIWSQEKVEDKYNYEGNKLDVAFLRYNLGYTAANIVLNSFATKGGGSYENLQNFLKTDEVVELLEPYNHLYDNDIPGKMSITSDYLANMRENLGYS